MSATLITNVVATPSSPCATGVADSCPENVADTLPLKEAVAVASAATCANQTPHNLQDIDNILSSPLISTPPPIHSDEQDECHYTLTQCNAEDSNHLNHASLSELLEHQTLLPFEKDRNVGVLNYKRTNQALKYSYEGYFAQCGLMTLLEQNLATQVCMCGIKSRKVCGTNPTGLCNRLRFCHTCAARAARRTLQTFQPRFHHHQWGFLTISYNGQIPLTYHSGSDWWLYWDAARTALKRLVDTAGVNGAIVREELAIPHLSPTTALPHVHAIVPTSELSPEAFERIRNWVWGYRDDLGMGVELEPSIDFHPITTEDEFERHVYYLHKPHDLVSPYATRWDNDASTAEKTALNRSMRDLIEALIFHPKGRHQIDYHGNMRASSKNCFIGVPKKER